MKEHKIKLILTCEHASNFIPAAYRKDFNHATLSSHKGFDIGAQSAAEFISKSLKCPLILGKVSRLLIDLNRSKTNDKYFSNYTKQLTPINQSKIIDKYYLPFRNTAYEHIQNSLKNKKNIILHVSVHSFTPKLNGQDRNNDIGLLYDPSHHLEKTFSKQWADNLKLISDNSIKVRFNYPYLGTSDGHTSALRKQIHHRYIGIELEINQRLANNIDNCFDTKLLSVISDSLKKSIVQIEQGL